MTPEDFMQKWQIDKKELAEILDLSFSQVERWFFTSGENKSSPKRFHLNRLSEIDSLLTILISCQTMIDICPVHIKMLKNKVVQSHHNDVHL